MNARGRLVKEVEEAVKVLWPEAVVQPFGSFFSDMSTFLSDVDVTVLGIDWPARSSGSTAVSPLA